MGRRWRREDPLGIWLGSWPAGSRGSWPCPRLSRSCTLLENIANVKKSITISFCFFALTSSTKLVEPCSRRRVVKLRRWWWQIPTMSKNQRQSRRQILTSYVSNNIVYYSIYELQKFHSAPMTRLQLSWKENGHRSSILCWSG